MKAQQTHCRRGHEYNEENTYRKPNATRACRKCHNENEKSPEARVRRAAYAKEWREKQKKERAPDADLSARSVLAWLQKKRPEGPVSPRNVMNGVRSQKWCVLMDDVNIALATLERSGAIRFLPSPERPPGKRGRSPARQFEVLPGALVNTSGP
jgi:hypothetical protein